jgi:MFS family permease
MAYPVMPLFLKSLGAPMAALGLIEGLADACANVLKGVAGVRSDQRRERTQYIRWGYGLSAAAKPLLAVTTGWPALVAVRLLDRYGKGIRTTPRDAMLAECAPPHQLGSVFGFHRAMDTAGAFVGVILALLLLQLLPQQYRLIFLLAGLPGAVALVLALGLREPAHHGPTPKERPKVRAHLPRGLLSVLAIHSAFALANTSDAFLLLRAKDLGFSETSVLAAYLLFNLTYVLGSWPAGRLSDRIGRWTILLVGWLCYSAVYLGFAVGGAGMVWVLFAAYGLYQALTQGSAKAQIAELAPKDLKGTALGVFAVTTGLSALVGNLAFGWVWDQWGAETSFKLSALVALAASVAAGVAMVLVRRNRSES